MINRMFGKFEVAYFSEVQFNMTSMLWMETEDFSSSVRCDRPLAFHKASCKNLAITGDQLAPFGGSSA
jgi:hypothetical protein